MNSIEDNIRRAVDGAMQWFIIDTISSKLRDDKIEQTSLTERYEALKQKAIEAVQEMEDIDINEYIKKAIDNAIVQKSTWHVGTGRDLPVSRKAKWDGGEAKKRIFEWAGFNGDEPSPEKARKAFLLYDGEKPELRGSYKDPIADVIDGKLTVVYGALRAAASRLPQTDVPKDVKDRARKVIDHYMKKLKKEDTTKEWAINFISKSADDEKQIVYGVVYGPRDVPDAQGDLMTADEVENMAHKFLVRKISRVEEAIDWQHEYDISLEDAIPVESYISPVDFSMNGHEIHKGDWILATYIPDKEKWEMVKSGEIKAYSIKGRGYRDIIE